MRMLLILLMFASIAVAEEEDKGMKITSRNDTDTGIIIDTTEEGAYLTLAPPESPFVFNINGYPWKRCKDGIIGLDCQYWCAKEERWLDADALCGSLSDN